MSSYFPCPRVAPVLLPPSTTILSVVVDESLADHSVPSSIMLGLVLGPYSVQY